MAKEDGRIGSHDVLLGKPQHRYTHEGNVFLRKLVREEMEQAADDLLMSCPTESGETFRSIVQQIHSKGGKFLRWNAVIKGWTEVPLEVAMVKVRAEFENHKRLTMMTTNSEAAMKPKEPFVSETKYAENSKDPPEETQSKRQHSLTPTAPTQLSNKPTNHSHSTDRNSSLTTPDSCRQSTTNSSSQSKRVSSQTLGRRQETSSSIKPTDNDYLCGKKNFCAKHLGTKFVKSCVDRRIREYEDAEKGRKESINVEIVLQVYARGGRFLSHSHGTWTVLSFTESRRKAGTLFRTKLTQVKKDKKPNFHATAATVLKPAEELGENDVPLNCAWYQTHPGLLCLRGLVDKNAEQYTSSTSKQFRDGIITDILKSVSEKGGTFKSNKTGRWETVSNHVARAKVTEEMTKACQKVKSSYSPVRPRTDSWSTSHSVDTSLNTIDLSARDLCETQSIEYLFNDSGSFPDTKFNSIEIPKKAKRQRSGCSATSSKQSKPATKMTRSVFSHHLAATFGSVSPRAGKPAANSDDVSELSASLHSSALLSSVLNWAESCSSLGKRLTSIGNSWSDAASVATADSSFSNISLEVELPKELETATVAGAEKPTQMVVELTAEQENNESLSEPMSDASAASLLDEMKAGIDDVALLTRSFGELSHLIWNGCSIPTDTAAASVHVVVEAINKHSANPQLTGYGCLALAWLTSALDSSRGSVLRDVGAVLLVVKSMRSHPTVDLVQESGVKALVALVRGGFCMTQDMAIAGGIQAVVAAMAKHPFHEQIQEYGCILVALMATADPTLVPLIADAHGVEAVAKALKNHPQSLSVQRNGCFAFRWLGCDGHVGQDRVRAVGGLVLVQAARRMFPSGAELQAYARELLSSAPSHGQVEGCPPLSEDDVLFGRDHDAVNATGNQKLQKVVADEPPTFQTSDSKGKFVGKGTVMTRVIDTFHQARGEISSSVGSWVGASRTEAAKASRRFRGQVEGPQARYWPGVSGRKAVWKHQS